MLSAATLWAMAVAFWAEALRGFADFGLAAIVVRLLLVVYESRPIVALVAVLSLFVAAAVVRDSWREADRRVALALLPALPGLAAGAKILRVVDPAYVRLAIGVLVAVAVVLLLRDNERLPGAGTRWGAPLTGPVSGTLPTARASPAPCRSCSSPREASPRRRFAPPSRSTSWS